eukprot:scaffold3203_cov228-Ochromonas_danica.AAC.1
MGCYHSFHRGTYAYQMQPPQEDAIASNGEDPAVERSSSRHQIVWKTRGFHSSRSLLLLLLLPSDFKSLPCCFYYVLLNG